MARAFSVISALRVVTAVAAVSAPWLVRQGAPTAPPVRARVIPFHSAAIALAVDPRTGRAFVTLYSASAVADEVALVDVRRGVLRIVPVGLNPVAIAIDARTRRVFVSCRGPLRPDGVEARGRGSIAVLDADTGRLLRTERGVRYPEELAVDEASGRVFALNLHIVSPAEGRYTPVNRDTLALLDARDGRLLRTLAPGAPGLGNSPSLGVDEALGRVFMLLQDGIVRTLDARTGAILRTTRIPDGDQYDVYTLFVDRSRHRVVVSGTGTVPSFAALIDGRTGRIARDAAPAQSGTVDAVDGVHGRAVFIDAYHGGSREYSTGSAYVLDTGTGRVLGTVSLGSATVGASDPDVAAVDEGAGRAYIATMRGLAVVNDRDGRVLHRVPMGASPDAMVSDGPTRSLLLLSNVGPATGLTVLDTSHL